MISDLRSAKNDDVIASIGDMVTREILDTAEQNRQLDKVLGVYGLNLLGYKYNPFVILPLTTLNKVFIQKVLLLEISILKHFL